MHRVLVAVAVAAACHGTQSLGDHVPNVTESGLPELDPASPKLVVTTTAISVEGKAIVTVKDGAVDPAELEGGASGIAIPKLRTVLSTLAKPETRLALELDPAVPYHLLVSVVLSGKKAGWRDFDLVVRDGKGLAAVPLTLPEAGKFSGGVRPVVTITKGHLLLWSVSGTQGTLLQPKLDVALDHVADLRNALVKSDEAIILMADGATPMQDVATVMATVEPMFPSILLSTGLE